jgi:hypothetical protein
VLKNKLITILFLLLNFCSDAQNLKADFGLIEKAFEKNPKLSMDLAIEMFENYTTNKVYFAQSGSIKKNGKDYNYYFDNTETINTSNYTLSVDKDEKTIMYMPKTRIGKPEMPYKVNYDSLLTFCKKYNYVTLPDKRASCDFIMKDFYPEYERVTIEYSTRTYLVDKIIFYCKEDDISIDDGKEKMAKARIELNYRNMNTKPVFTSEDFSYQKYLTKNGDKLVLKTEYKKFKLTVLPAPKQ